MARGILRLCTEQRLQLLKVRSTRFFSSKFSGVEDIDL